MLTPFLDGLWGLPMWFVGGLIGLVVNVAALMLMTYYLRVEGPMLGVMTVGLCVTGWVLFAWPLWPTALVAASVLWQMAAPPRRQLLPGAIDNAALIPVMMMTISALLFLRMWPAIVAAPVFLFAGFMVYMSAAGVRG